jgi:LA2681-like HEPN
MTEATIDANLNIAGLSDSDALERIGLLIDASYDSQSVAGTDRAFELLDELQGRNPPPHLVSLVHYFRANAWHNRCRAETGREWAWEQPECQAEILELRRAIKSEGFEQLPTIRRCQIFTNLANQLNRIGRFIEAVETWDRALLLEKKFAMAGGNRGLGLSHYARSVYDPGHATIMLIAAHDALTAATEDDALYESDGYQGVRTDFESERQQIASRMDVAALRQKANHKHSLGKSAAERRYRTWCLHNRLFINPLNDLGPLPIADRDILTLPSMTDSTGSPRPPALFGFFNQMKQELVSARYLYYDGIHQEDLHFSDRDVLLYNTLDYPVYSLATEKLRAAFRLAYSLFDKISFFLNDYFTLGINPNRVSFRSVWYEEKGSRPLPLRQPFVDCPNWPLRGLFWLSKDLFEQEFQLATEPDAAALNEIRNHVEHKYLQLHKFLISASSSIESNRIGYSLSRDDFAAKTLRLLKLARAALVYLSLAVHREERQHRKSEDGKITVSIPLHPLKDEWKP